MNNRDILIRTLYCFLFFLFPGMSQAVNYNSAVYNMITNPPSGTTNKQLKCSYSGISVGSSSAPSGNWVNCNEMWFSGFTGGYLWSKSPPNGNTWCSSNTVATKLQIWQYTWTNWGSDCIACTVYQTRCYLECAPLSLSGYTCAWY